MTQSNGKNGTHAANGTNGNRHAGPVLVTSAQPAPSVISIEEEMRPASFDKPVVLQQSPIWSRAIVWAIVGVTSSLLLWAAFAEVEQAIPARGKLEPTGAVKEVQAPVGGVVKTVHVKDGDRVKAGDLLISFDPTASKAQLDSLQNIRAKLLQENQFYRTQMNQALTPLEIEEQIARLNISPAMASLTKSRVTLVAENRLYRLQLGDASGAGSLSAEQVARLQNSQSELRSRVAAADLEVGQLERQLRENDVQLASAKDSLAVNQEILSNVEPLLEDGGIARLQVLQQQLEVRTGQSEVQRLTESQQRLKLAIAQAQERLQNTVAFAGKDLFTQLADNEKRIAEIDSQISRAVVDNEKRIAEIDGQLEQAALTLRYQEIKAPVDGVIFDLQAGGPGFVANTSEPILKLVPEDSLIAKVDITNQDIGFVEPEMKVDVRIDSFPYSEFGDVKGTLIEIGSDALPPTDIKPFYTFPAKIRLDQQSLKIQGKEVPLQSGMSISANIKVRKRTVLSIFTELFQKKTESITTVR